jgi:hypothetical protein
MQSLKLLVTVFKISRFERFFKASFFGWKLPSRYHQLPYHQVSSDQKLDWLQHSIYLDCGLIYNLIVIIGYCRWQFMLSFPIDLFFSFWPVLSCPYLLFMSNIHLNQEVLHYFYLLPELNHLHPYILHNSRYFCRTWPLN